MREVKFRAWNSIDNRMVDWSTFKANPDFLMNVIKGVKYYDHLMQCTGLKDKNGVEIYEGDIVSQHAEWNETSYIAGGYEDSNSCETETIGVIAIYPSKGVVITRAKKTDLIACDEKWQKTWDLNARSCRVAVIGNIHQDQELLP